MAEDPKGQIQQDAEVEPLVEETLEEVAGGGCSLSLCSFSE